MKAERSKQKQRRRYQNVANPASAAKKSPNVSPQAVCLKRNGCSPTRVKNKHGDRSQVIHCCHCCGGAARRIDVRWMAQAEPEAHSRRVVHCAGRKQKLKQYLHHYPDTPMSPIRSPDPKGSGWDSPSRGLSALP